MEEKKRKKITWEELESMLRNTDTSEEVARGLVQAISGCKSGKIFEEVARKLAHGIIGGESDEIFEKVQLLICIGSETSEFEPSGVVRQEANKVLARHIIPKVIEMLYPIKQWDLPMIMTLKQLITYYSQSKLHSNRLGERERMNISYFLEALWEIACKRSQQNIIIGREYVDSISLESVEESLVVSRNYHFIELKLILRAVPVICKTMGIELSWKGWEHLPATAPTPSVWRSRESRQIFDTFMSDGNPPLEVYSRELIVPDIVRILSAASENAQYLADELRVLGILIAKTTDLVKPLL